MNRKPSPPRKMQTGWTRFNQFPSTMGFKINPYSTFFAKSARLMVAVIGPRHHQRTGVECSVRSVSGNLSRVVLGERLETYTHPPISFYKFKRLSFIRGSKLVERSAMQLIASSERDALATEAEVVRTDANHEGVRRALATSQADKFQSDMRSDNG